MMAYCAGTPWKMVKEQHILDTAFRLFSDRGIEPVTMPDVTAASGVSRATLYRYFPSKQELVIAIGMQKWEVYFTERDASLPQALRDQMTVAELLRFFLDAFLDLYHNHKDILRFNYNFNIYLRYEAGTVMQNNLYKNIVEKLRSIFHQLYEHGLKDGTLNTMISEEKMLSTSFHIMLAAVTCYATGLVYEGINPENELVLLENMLFREFVTEGALS